MPSAESRRSRFQPGTVVCRGSRHTGLAALIFDDGPMPGVTPCILRALARADVKATFFVVGRKARVHRGIVRGMEASGQLLENHSLSHGDMRRLGRLRQEAQIDATNRVLQRCVVARPAFFRPPYGLYNHSTCAVAALENQEIVYWSVDPRDWDARSSRQHILNACMRARSGDIILLHERRRTAEMLPNIIEGLRTRGLRPVTLSVLLDAQSSRTAARPAAKE